MIIAESLRKDNVCEYLLYMWQVEDLLRSCNLDERQVERVIVRRFPREVRDAERGWLRNLMDMMKEEGCQEKGHAQVNQGVLSLLEDLHHDLLKGERHPDYRAAYYRALPDIVFLRAHGNMDKGEVEVCLEALYGIMLLRLQKKPVARETERAIKLIAELMRQLSVAYKEEKGL